MTPERIALLKAAYERQFGETYERGVEEVRFLTRSFIVQSKADSVVCMLAMALGGEFHSTNRLSDRDMCRLAFFTHVGIEVLTSRPDALPVVSVQDGPVRFHTITVRSEGGSESRLLGDGGTVPADAVVEVLDDDEAG